MSIAPTKSPADPRSAPSRTRQSSGTQATQIDAIRVLRQNARGILASALVGLGVGFMAHIVCDFVYPLYTDTVLF
jgi:uncharacterized metal-binding protein